MMGKEVPHDDNQTTRCRRAGSARPAAPSRLPWLGRLAGLLAAVLLVPPLAPSLAAAGDPPGETESWERFFGGETRDTSIAVASFPDGGVISAGYTRSVGNGDADVLVLRLDKTGALSWHKTFGGPARDLATAVTVLPDGGFVTAAVTQSGEGEGEGEGDALISRHSASGDVVWQNRFGGDKYDIPYAVQIDAKGHIIIAGYTKSSGLGDSDGWVFELDRDGKLLWEHTYGTEGRDWLRALAVMPNGDIAVAGGTKSGKESATSGWVMRLDPRGVKRWERIFSDEESVARTIVGLGDNEIAIAGSVLSKDRQTGRDIWLARLDGNGQMLFEKKLGGSGDDQTEALIAMPDGGVALAGGTTQNLAVVTVRTAWMMRLDRRGKLLWKRTFEGKSDQLYGLCSLPGERIAASGTSWQQNKSEDVWVFTLDKHGRRTLPGEMRPLQSSIQ